MRRAAAHRRRTPSLPFTIDEWLASPWTEYRSCIGWHAPSTLGAGGAAEPAVYPDVPTLVLVG